MSDEDSVNQLVEFLTSAFKKESLVDLHENQRISVAPGVFRLRINHGREFALDEVNSHGIYRIFLEETLFHCADELPEAVKQLLTRAFKRRLSAEIIAIYSGPPKLTFQWRYGGSFEGLLRDHTPTCLSIEVFGITVATINEDMQLTRLEYFFDSGQFLQNTARPEHFSNTAIFC